MRAKPSFEATFLTDTANVSTCIISEFLFQIFAGKELLSCKMEGRGRSPKGSRATGLALVKNAFSAMKVTQDRTPAGYFSFAYSAFASFRMVMSGSASFQRVRQSGYRGCEYAQC